MKLNEIAGGKVWMLISEEDYESNYVHGIFTSKALAAKAQKEFEKDEDLTRYRRPAIVEVPLNKFNEFDWNQKTWN